MPDNGKNIGNPASTTEELIVQYLDGELVRKELETVLFDRLLHSEDARALLRDYLVMRGAIRVSREDERFQLSSDLDMRTRARIEQLLVTITSEEVPSGFLEDKPAIATNAATRSLKRWALRPSIAALALLLAIGTTWFVTRSTISPSSTLAPSGEVAQAVPSQTAKAPASALPSQSASQMPPATAEMSPLKQTPPNQASVTSAKAAQNRRMPSFAQNTVATQSHQSEQKAAEQPASGEKTSDAADVMLFPRFSKAINAAEKHEVVITSHDRL
jgi:hypothetical protein